MNNPYQSPATQSDHQYTVPWWYIAFCWICQPFWWVGITLFICHLLGYLPDVVGWIGLGLVIFAVVGSHVFPSFIKTNLDDAVALDSRMLESKGDDYYHIIARFEYGATLAFDGLTFALMPNNEIACGVIAYLHDFNKSAANQLVSHANQVFVRLKQESPEFAAAVSGRTFRISILSGTQPDSPEICRYVDNRFEWFQGQETAQ